ncbi:MAG: TMEM175 family protein [Sphingomicrobium sp.]
MKDRAESELKPDNHRIEAFSDGVFAIVITIMVLEVRIPDSLAFGSDRSALVDFATYLGTYALSFLVIANLWTSHHYLSFTLRRPARATLWYNNLLLFCVTLVPIGTRFLGMHPGSPRAGAAYGLVAAACTAGFILLRAHAARLTDNPLHRGIHHRIIRRATLFLVIYLASIPLAFVSMWLAWACFVIVPPMLFLPLISGPVPAGHSREERALERSCP